VSPDNINRIIQQNREAGPIGLLSIDIDGNDYWIWKAIEDIKPAIVVIEVKVEYGLRNIVVPYSENNIRTYDERYNGASVPALVNLARSKGYKFAGANKQGYNLFFVLQDTAIPVTTAEAILDDKEILACFYPEPFFVTHQFVSG
jgi:hypothetical protein